MGQRLADRVLTGLATPPYLAHKHRALERGNAKVGQSILVGLLRQSSCRLFLDKKCGNIVLDDLKNEIDVLADMLNGSLMSEKYGRGAGR